eukprot:COSAG02_NODE_446_length_22141_cov_17.963842_3_plen_77_part_00
MEELDWSYEYSMKKSNIHRKQVRLALSFTYFDRQYIISHAPEIDATSPGILQRDADDGGSARRLGGLATAAPRDAV